VVIPTNAWLDSKVHGQRSCAASYTLKKLLMSEWRRSSLAACMNRNAACSLVLARLLLALVVFEVA